MEAATIFFKYDYGLKERGESLEKKVFLPAIEKNIGKVSPFWLEENGYSSDIDQLQQNILKFCEEVKPDIVFFILMKDEIKAETIKELSKKYLTINWFCDDQWRFESFTQNIAPLLTYSVTVDKYSLPKYKKINCKAIHSQWAAMEYDDNVNFNDIQYNYDVSFIGGKNIAREWYIYELNKKGFNIQCFGSGWDNGRISYDQMKDIFRTSKINLNLSNSIPKDIRFYKYLLKRIFTVNNKNESFIKKVKTALNILLNKSIKNVEQMKARNFEIPGLGGFQLSQYCPELEDYYDIGKEVSIFSNIDDLMLNINFYLNNDKIREDIRIKSHIKTGIHTYEARIKEIIKEVKRDESLLGGR